MLRVKAGLGCVSLGESENGFVISDHSDHGASKEPTNPLWTRIRRVPWIHQDPNDLR